MQGLPFELIVLDYAKPMSCIEPSLFFHNQFPVCRTQVRCVLEKAQYRSQSLKHAEAIKKDNKVGQNPYTIYGQLSHTAQVDLAPAQQVRHEV